MLERTSCLKLDHLALSCLPHLDNTERPLLLPPAPNPTPAHPRLTLRDQQHVEENQEAVDVIKTLTTGNNYTAQAAVFLPSFRLFFRLLGRGGYGPSLVSFQFWEIVDLDQAAGNKTHILGFALGLPGLAELCAVCRLSLGDLRMHRLGLLFHRCSLRGMRVPAEVGVLPRGLRAGWPTAPHGRAPGSAGSN